MRLNARPGRHAQLIAQQLAEPVVDAERRCHVALGLPDLHEQQVAAFAERSALHERIGRLLGCRQLAAAERDAALRHRLVRLQRDVLEAAARLVEPRRVVPGQEPAVVEGDKALRREQDCHPVRALLRAEHVRELALGVREVDVRARAERNRRIARR